jgi:hypothetical protein
MLARSRWVRRMMVMPPLAMLRWARRVARPKRAATTRGFEPVGSCPDTAAVDFRRRQRVNNIITTS